jgi:hypothetical protein
MEHAVIVLLSRKTGGFTSESILTGSFDDNSQERSSSGREDASSWEKSLCEKKILVAPRASMG